MTGPEIIARPDLDAVLAEDKTKELIEEFEAEAKTRTFTGAWDAFVTSLAVGTTLFALYFAAAGAEIPFVGIQLVPSFVLFGQTITTPQIYVMIFLSAILVLTFLLYPMHPRFIKPVNVVDLALAAASLAVTGRRPTGAARTVTVASFLLGTVSGSGVATTVTLGSITYPMLKKAGHDRESSGAILSAGGIGAVISPPVLGPAAFLMAGILGLR